MQPPDAPSSELRELLAAEPEPIRAARVRAAAVTAVPPPEVGALLRWLASTAVARHVVQVPSDGGVTGLWLLAGMAPRGVLTTVDTDPAVHQLAVQAFEHARVTDRVRTILGPPSEVLPRLSDGGYELCVFAAHPSELPGLLEHAVRLLRPGGMLVVRGLLDTALARRFADFLAERPGTVGVLIPIADGIGVATVGG